MPKKSPLLNIPIPKELNAVQDWFASIITRPIDADNHMNLISPSGNPMEEEACKYIAPSPTLRPHQRIELYNQQYWWRLLSTLQEIFPLVTRLFGYFGFNQEIAFPYLVKYPPDHWSLIELGKHMNKWIIEDYHQNDQRLVYDSACLDWAFNDAFTIKQMPPLDLSNIPEPGTPESLLTVTLYLQPHIHLFSWNYNLFPFRHAFLAESPDYWLENDFPELPKGDFCFIVYRDAYNDICWKQISKAEYHLLVLFKNGGSTIEKACQFLEKQDQSICEEAQQHLHQWFQEWTVNGFLTLENPQ